MLDGGEVLMPGGVSVDVEVGISFSFGLDARTGDGGAYRAGETEGFRIVDWLLGRRWLNPFVSPPPFPCSSELLPCRTPLAWEILWILSTSRCIGVRVSSQS